MGDLLVGVSVGVGVTDGACVVGGADVGAWVVAVGDTVTDGVSLGVGLGEGSGSEPPLRAAHNAPAPRPSRIASTTAMMIGVFDGPSFPGSGSGAPCGGMAVVG